MKALVFAEYGSPDVLKIKEVEKPTPKDNEVLIKVHAASVNDWDWGLLRGKPFVNRLMFGILKPKVILGCDIAGRIEAVGSDIVQFKPGDEVFGDLSGGAWGGFSQYTCAKEEELTLKPNNMTFEQAAAFPQAGALGLQGLRDEKSKQRYIQPGQKVLINGAGGGAGSFAIQIAKSFGAEVTGVDGPNKQDIMRSIGADHVIDYTKEDFTKNGQQYDLIVDHMAFHSLFDYRRALGPKGMYIIAGGSLMLMIRILITGSLLSFIGDKKMSILALKANKGMDYLIELFEAGKVVPVIDKVYPLSEGAEALRYFGEGHKRGKVVISMEPES